jgi:hypothetical protein
MAAPQRFGHPAPSGGAPAASVAASAPASQRRPIRPSGSFVTPGVFAKSLSLKVSDWTRPEGSGTAHGRFGIFFGSLWGTFAGGLVLGRGAGDGRVIAHGSAVAGEVAKT